MHRFRAVVAATAAAGAVAAALALASGGPPPTEPPAPDAGTVVAHGSGRGRVAEPPERTDRSVQRAVDDARRRAIPRAVAAARDEAVTLAAAAGLRLGDAAGVARDVSPLGWYDETTGRFGPGRWCGPIVTWRTVRGDDGRSRRVRRSHHGCHKPPSVSVRVTVTFAGS
ncbi:MAG TPA: hypothetical protein VGW75_17520 [Solirubrobacteraceae bacterium]|jgi:hypothetical protein|nr:hypothetical protein [Solirubrobacteraceae bacterium]